MRQYETGFVLSPTLSEEETTQFIQQMAEIVAQKNGRMVKQDIWGKRRLAFPIKRFQEGVYVFFTYDGAGDVLRFGACIRCRSVLCAEGCFAVAHGWSARDHGTARPGSGFLSPGHSP